MTIRRAIPVYIGLSLLCIVVVSYVIAHVATLRGFSQIERREAERALAHAADLIDAELGSLRSAVGWATQSGDSGVVADFGDASAGTEAVPDVLRGLGVDCLIVLREDGSIAAGSLRGRLGADCAPLPSDFAVMRPGKEAALLSLSAASGVVMTTEGPMLFAAGPIRAGSAEGAGPGMLIVGRFTQSVVARLQTSLDARVSICSPGDSAGIVETGRIRRVYHLSHQVLAADMPLPSPAGVGALVLHVEFVRTLPQVADHATWYTMAGLACAGVVLTIMTIVFAERFLLNRLGRLVDAVRGIDGGGGLSSRVPVDGTDELADLGGTINRMLDAIGGSQAVLRASEDRFRRMADSIPDGLAIMEGGATVYVNDRMCEITGYPREELMRLSGFDLAVPEERDRLRTVMDDIRKGMYPHELEFWIQRKDGTRRRIRNRYSLSSEAGVITGRFLVTTDITEHVVASRELRRLKDFNELIVQTVAEGIIVEDTQGLYSYVNPAAAAMLGYPAEELVGQPWTAVVPPDQQPLVDAANLRRRQGVSDRYELDVMRRDGSRIQVSVSGAPLMEGGVFAGTIAVYADISQRKREEREREELLLHTQRQAEQIRRIMDTVPEGVVVTDEAFQVVLTNRAAEAHLRILTEGRTESAAMLGGVPLADLLGSDLAASWHELRPTSSDRIFAVAARPLDSYGWVLIIREVTDERAAQLRAEAAERMEAIGQVAAGIAHDFNNILASIIGHAQLLLRDQSLPEGVAERIGGIADQGQRAASLVGQLLDYARRSLLDRAPVDLGAVVREIGAELGRMIPESIHLSIQHPSPPCCVDGSVAQLSRALMNLARNAVDAMPAGGELRIDMTCRRLETGELPSRDMAPGEWVLISIADTGHGIRSEHMNRLFQPFFTTKAVGKGTGLGLAQAYGLVRQHGGFIDVATELHRGTTFTVYLPLLSREAASPSAAGAPPDVASGRTILLVEDEQPVREVIEAMLRESGFSVIQASSGAQALEIYRLHPDDIDVVLTDLMMPGMDGITLAEHVARLNPAARVVVVSGYPLDGVSRQRLSAIAGGWLQKPVIMERLQQTVAAALGHRPHTQGTSEDSASISSMRA